MKTKIIFLLLTIFLIPFGYAYSEERGIEVKPKGRAGYKDAVTGMEFIFIKGGCYQMGDTFGDGDNDEKPLHEVCVDDFYMGETEVTQRQWVEIMGPAPAGSKQGSNSSYFKGCDDCPIEQVSWNDIQGFIKRLNEKTTPLVPLNKGGFSGLYRLPTEAEWEYAAKSGGKNEKWAGTSSESKLREYAWYSSNSGSKTHPVKQKKPNGLGLYDMSGNVWEWCSDLYGEGYYRNSPQDNPKGPSIGSYRILRGGSWDDEPGDLRASIRVNGTSVDGVNVLGFRLAAQD
jgi:formylglycine-generating enzyme required for sulfatase activity